MAAHTKTRRRLRFLAFTLLLLTVSAAAVYSIRQRQISARILAGREQGYTALADGDYFTALHNIGPYLRRHPQDTEALFKYARARQNVPEPNSKHIADAMSLYRRLLEMDPQHAGARHVLLEIYIQYGLNTEILEFTQGREDLKSRAARIIALNRLRRVDEALRLAEEYTALDPLNLQQQVVALELLRQSGKPASDLIARAQGLYEQYPDDPRFELLLSIAHLMNRDAGNALELARRAASRPIQDTTVVDLLVGQLDALNSFEDARAVLEKAATLPDGQQFRISAMRRLLDAGQTQVVVERLAKLDASDAGVDAELLALRALAHLKLGERQQARPIIAALAERETDVVASAWMGVLQTVFVEGKPRDRQVIQACRDAIQNCPDNPYFRFYLSEAYARAGDEVAALKELVAAHELARGWAMPLNSLARLMLSSGRAPDALQASQAAHERAPDDPLVLITLVMAKVATTSPTDSQAVDEMFEMLDRVEQLAPGDQESLVMRVDMLAQLDRKPQAIHLLEKCLVRQPALAAPSLLQLASISRAHQLGLEDKCLQVCEEVHGVTSDLAWFRALALFRAGDHQAGLRLLEAARQAAPDRDSREWQLVWARYLESIADERAQQQWVKLASAQPDDADVQHFALQAASMRGQRQFLRQTIDRLGQIIGPDGIEWKIADAQWLIAEGSTEQDVVGATVMLNEVARRVPEHVMCRRLLAECLARLNRPTVAIEQLFLAARYEPRSNPIFIRLASMLHSVGDFDRAGPVLSQIQQNLEAPRSVITTADDDWRALAQLHSERGDHEQAMKVLQARSAATTQPTLIDIQLALLYAQRGALTEEFCQRLLRNPDPAAIGIVADFYANRGDEEQAQQLLIRLDQMQLQPGVAQLLRARYYERRGDDKQVLKELTDASKAAPNDPRTWRALTAYHIVKGQGSEASSAAQRGLEAVPTDEQLGRYAKHAELIAPMLEHEPVRTLAVSLLDPAQDHATIIDALRVMSSAMNGQNMTVAQVLPQLRPLADRAPRLLPLQQFVATLSLASGNTEQALAIATRAMHLFPNEPEPARLAAQSLAILGRWPELRSVAEQWKRRSPRSTADADAMIAAAHLSMSDPAAALRTIEPHVHSAIEAPGRGEEILRLYLHASVVTGKADEAADQVEPILGKSPGLRAAWMQLAAQAIADHAVAETWLAKVEPLIDHSSVGERMMLAHAWMMLAQRSDLPAHRTSATEALERASRDLHNAQRTTPQEWEGVAMLYEAAGKIEAAEECYRKALQLNPDLPITQNNLAMLLVTRDGDLKDALSLATKAAAHLDHPMCASFLDTLATIQVRLKQFEDAVRAMSDAVERDPRNVKWRVNLVQVLRDSGQLDQAKVALRDIDRQPGDPAQLPQDTRRRLDALRAELE